MDATDPTGHMLVNMGGMGTPAARVSKPVPVCRVAPTAAPNLCGKISHPGPAVKIVPSHALFRSVGSGSAAKQPKSSGPGLSFNQIFMTGTGISFLSPGTTKSRTKTAGETKPIPIPLPLPPDGGQRRSGPTCASAIPAGANANAQNGGWDYYAPPGSGGGGTEAIVCATKINKKYNRPSRAVTPAWTAAGVKAGSNPIARCHLAPSVLGGTGAWKNLAPCYARTNNPDMETFETRAANQVRAGRVVEYTAVPEYRASGGGVPYEFSLDYISWNAQGSVVGGGSIVIQNDAMGTLTNLG